MQYSPFAFNLNRKPGIPLPLDAAIDGCMMAGLPKDKDEKWHNG
ncbi:MAG: hypothetical protein OXF74_00445 [Rhodobacteraceae bacterium]|nr:hypothetical protein [Paracoccaceae bacterium]